MGLTNIGHCIKLKLMGFNYLTFVLLIFQGLEMLKRLRTQDRYLQQLTRCRLTVMASV